MDYRYVINKKFEEHPSLAKAGFRYEGEKCEMDIRRHNNCLYAFICLDGKLEGEVTLECNDLDEVFDGLKTQKGVENLKIDVLNLF